MGTVRQLWKIHLPDLDENLPSYPGILFADCIEYFDTGALSLI